ncbi:MAG: hypothetical protein AB9869_27635 [Verrucomicrobiia bacterium]
MISWLVLFLDCELNVRAQNAQNALSSGDNQTGAISAVRPGEEWTFNAASGDDVYLRVSQTSGGTSFAPRVRIYDEAGNMVGTASGGNASNSSSARLRYSPSESGAFTVLVDSAVPGGTGSYRVDYLRLPGEVPVPGGETGGSLENEGRHEGSITLGDLDVWTFEAGPGETVCLRAAQIFGADAFAPRVRIYDAGGSLVAAASGPADSDFSEARLEYRPAATNAFTAVVDASLPEETGGYRLFYLKLPRPAETPPADDGGALTNGNNHDGTTAVGDLDVWTLQANAGDRVTFELSQLSGGTSYSPRALVFSPSTKLIG